MNRIKKGLFYFKSAVPLGLYCLLISTIQAAELVYKNSILPPPVVDACPPIPPIDNNNVADQTIDACLSFKEIHKKYLKKEKSGESYLQNRNVKYFEIFERFMFEGYNRYAEIRYTFNLSDVMDYFGYPDYVNITKVNNQKIERYAYLFDYKGIKDYAILLTSKKDKITSVRFNEKKHLTTSEWEEY